MNEELLLQRVEFIGLLPSVTGLRDVLSDGGVAHLPDGVVLSADLAVELVGRGGGSNPISPVLSVPLRIPLTNCTCNLTAHKPTPPTSFPTSYAPRLLGLGVAARIS